MRRSRAKFIRERGREKETSATKISKKKKIKTNVDPSITNESITKINITALKRRITRWLLPPVTMHDRTKELPLYILLECPVYYTRRPVASFFTNRVANTWHIYVCVCLCIHVRETHIFTRIYISDCVRLYVCMRACVNGLTEIQKRVPLRDRRSPSLSLIDAATASVSSPLETRIFI